jgi:hypothetical protein
LKDFVMQLPGESPLVQATRLPLVPFSILFLAAAVSTACLAQDVTLPPGPMNNGSAPSMPMPAVQQPGPAAGFFAPQNPAPASLVPPNQPPSFSPGPIPQNQPLGMGEPVGQPVIGSLPAAVILPQQSPMPAGPTPDSDGKSKDPWLPDDMVGFGGMGGMGQAGGFRGGMNPTDSFRYSILWFPTVPVKDQPTDLQMIGENLSFTHPLWKDSLNAFSLTGGVRNELLRTDAILPNTGQPLPSDLWGASLGLHYSRQLEDGWITGGGLSIGSASDHPFASIREMNFGMNAMLRIPQGEHDAWLFTLAYSPMGELNFPVPGVAYSWNPAPEFHANLGLPLMVMWRPTDDWQIQASYMLIRTVHIKSQYRLAQRLWAFAAYDWSNESYILLDRPDLNDRFFIYDQRVSIGLQTPLWQNWSASVSSGLVFDRYMFEGTSSAGNSSDRVNLGSGPFGALNLSARF